MKSGRGVDRPEFLDNNHARYEVVESSDDSGSDGIDFETAAASQIQAHALYRDEFLEEDDGIALQELAADFSSLGRVLAGVPLWARLGGTPDVREALCGEDDVIDVKALLKNDDLSDGASGGASDAATPGDVPNVTEDPSPAAARAVAAEGIGTPVPAPKDDFDAWLDDA